MFVNKRNTKSTLCYKLINDNWFSLVSLVSYQLVRKSFNITTNQMACVGSTPLLVTLAVILDTAGVVNLVKV